MTNKTIYDIYSSPITKKEALRKAIRTIVEGILKDNFFSNEKYIDEKTNEILKEVSIRYLIN